MSDDTPNVINLATAAEKARQRAETLALYDPTEDGVALAFTAAHKDVLRFDHTEGKWYRWTGAFWEREETKLAFQWAREACREFQKQVKADGRKPSATLSKSGTAAGVERFAQAAREFAITSHIWDSSPWHIGTPDGMVDLRTGEMLPPDATAYIRRYTAVSPAPTPHCPEWDKFLLAATRGDLGLIRFMRQWAGYCLTGDTREHALMFIYGPGGNGKSVWLNTIAGIMGTYTVNAPMDTFTASSQDKHPTDLARLAGARMVSANETEEGRAWAEVRIKALTGGDNIAARFMRQDFFEFRPTFKLIVVGNHKPGLKNVDDAARRRFNVVPFIHKPETPDRDLETKLRAEWPAILRWMIEGCLDWQRNGLVRPEVVLTATAEYFSEQDLVKTWIEDECQQGPQVYDTSAALFKAWSAFAVANGEKPGSTKWLTQTLTKYGFEQIKHVPGEHKGRGFRGIAVIRRAEPHWQDR